MNKTLIKRKSELMAQIRNEFKILQALQPDFDNAFFDDESMLSYMHFRLIYRKQMPVPCIHPFPILLIFS
jgi:hypothetical protein